jgi:MoxR-like ATPase
VDVLPTQDPAHATSIARIRAAIRAVIHGKDDVIDTALVAVVAGGHLLLDDVPGVGKTTLANALAASIGGTFSRVQFTADLLPADVTGGLVLDRASGQLTFRPGPVFANVVLADELNRTSPRTQSALFEAMEEGRVTVDGTTRPLPRPFLVVATQNPHDAAGTFPLPDSQLDRFLMKLSLGYPAREAEREVLRRGRVGRPTVPAAVDPAAVIGLIVAAEGVSVPSEVEDLILDVADRSRHDERLLRGVSTRAALGWFRATRARALVGGRAFAVPEDARALAPLVLGHRVLPRSGSGEAAIRALLAPPKRA